MHHATVSLGSLFKRKRLDHRPNILQDKRVLVIDRLAGQTTNNRTLTKNNWKRIDWHRIVRQSYNDQLAVDRKTTHQGCDRIGCGEDCVSSSNPLQSRGGIIRARIDVGES